MTDDPHKTRHIWKMVNVQEGVKASPIAGVPGVAYVSSSWLCHCGKTKLVVRRAIDQTPPDDPEHLVVPDSPVEGPPFLPLKP